MPRGVYDRKKKAKEVPVEKSVKVEKPVSNKPVGHSMAFVDEYRPSPDMGKIQAPSSDVTICNCLHQKKMHYGPTTDWCNVAACQCQAFKAKED